MYTGKALQPLRMLTVLVFATGLPFGLRAVDAPPPKADVSVSDLIQKLKSDDAGVRDAARKALSDKGYSIRANLQKALDDAGQDADFLEQIKQVMKNLSQIERLRSFDQPVTIDLEVKDLTVKEALEKLKATFGITVPVSEAAASAKFDLSKKGMSFFEALDAVRKAAKLGLRVDQNAAIGGNMDPLTLCATLEEPGKGWCSVSPCGPFMFVVQSVSINKTRNANRTNRENKQLILMVMCLPMPGLTGGTVTTSSSKFVDAKGTETNGYHDEPGKLGLKFGEWSINPNSKIAICIMDGMQMPAEISGPISWEADFKVQVPIKVVSKTLANLSKGGTVEIANEQITVNNLERTDNGWKLRIVLPSNSEFMQGCTHSHMMRIGGGGGGDEEKPHPYTPGYFVLNGAGNLIHATRESSSGDESKVTYDLTFDEEPKSIQFQWYEEKADRILKVKLPEIPIP